MTDTFADKFFADLESGMTDAFNAGDQERGHIEADDLLVRLVEKLLRSYVRIGERQSSPLTIEHYGAIRRTLAFYKDMDKWYA